MPLLLIEATPATTDRDGVESVLAGVRQAASSAGGDLLEAQVPADLSRVFAVVEGAEQAPLEKALGETGVTFDDVAEVRVVGATVEEIRARRGDAAYLVEWDLPAGLTMETYLERKKEKAPLYAKVPEVSFLRTYVREDMGKCLCFYDAPDEEAVRRARDAVTTPIDRLHRLDRGPSTDTE
jgi:hypothetical protein